MTPIRRSAVAALAFLAACTEPPLPATPPSGAQQALFATYPGAFFDDFAASCRASGATVVRPGADELRCESLPDPGLAAALILEFDGTVEALPVFVDRVYVEPVSEGFVVTTDSFLRIPQRDGTTDELRAPTEELVQSMRDALVRAGGMLL